ncbi:MAG: DNA-3-methyladenine glycosylase 2 family protein [Candidatus Heimdallarchaeota archaeon]|nr:DNA-3-methyladenine glycosylase 2 family protein [Candidatus Heimdallarchaeota archaeon]
MDDVPFYLKGTEQLIVSQDDVKNFIKQNPQLKKHISEFDFDLRILDYDLLTSFCYWIIGQQVSVRAAESITKRFLALVNPLTPEKLINTPSEALREVGLSRSKAEYVKNVAHYILDHKDHPIINHPKDYSSEEIRDFFTQIRGVGPWTVNMHLIFMMGKKDVFAPGDLAVRKGLKILYNLEAIPSIRECMKYHWGELSTIGTLLSWYVLRE